jgi:hypothetical protein
MEPAVAMTYQPKLTNMRGAGDLVEQVTKRTGIKALVDKVTGNRCGCGKRRDILNKLIPFRGEPNGVQSDHDPAE